MKPFLNIAIAGSIVLFIEYYPRISPSPNTSLSPSTSPSPLSSLIKPQCQIKGNISHNSGKKIYHLPGMEDCESTVIDRLKGEKWFCTESEAVQQGWHKAPR